MHFVLAHLYQYFEEEQVVHFFSTFPLKLKIYTPVNLFTSRWPSITPSVNIAARTGGPTRAIVNSDLTKSSLTEFAIGNFQLRNIAHKKTKVVKNTIGKLKGRKKNAIIGVITKKITK